MDPVLTPRRGLSFAYLRATNVVRCEAAFHPVDAWTPTDWATALAGEVGEACNFIKKLRRLQDDTRLESTDLHAAATHLIVEIGKELADVIIYADLLAARLGIDLGTEVWEKFNEVSRRRHVTVFLAAEPPDAVQTHIASMTDADLTRLAVSLYGLMVDQAPVDALRDALRRALGVTG